MTCTGSIVGISFTNTLNPKVALFFLFFFPQFIRKEYFNSPAPFITLGITYAILGVMWFLIITYFSSMFSDRLKANPGFNKWMNKTSGVVYILMGIKIAMTKR
ncbi:LysE family translocator [Chitinophaga rhizophila]|uniref:LysE family transporter n=1 Tax=Chitinophaga rhizophila TaxID=2866212 RepID=A0ABS7G939_9BACT|nr:LysE family transporter [Chitinophaga rhizophila]MBW8684174.1 LysE family transporter [Chitinophaga rhizophila]